MRLRRDDHTSLSASNGRSTPCATGWRARTAWRNFLWRVLDIAATAPAPSPEADAACFPRSPRGEKGAVIAACLLHDIARRDQLRDKRVCHAERGAKKAEKFLKKNGFDEDFAARVADCVRTHCFRKGRRAHQSIEAQILYDADKIDVCGATGIARTLHALSGPLRRANLRRAPGRLACGRHGEEGRDLFVGEYKRKLEAPSGRRLFTSRARAIARERLARRRRFTRASTFRGLRLAEKGRELLQTRLTEDMPAPET